MLKVLIIAAGIFGLLGTAQADEVVKLKAKAVYSSSGEKSISFSSKACGLKAIAFGFEGKQISWVRYSQAVASYQTGSEFDIDRDIFNSYGMIMAGEVTPWFQLRENAPCLRKVYLTAETELWPTTEGAITVYGLK